MNLFEPRAIRSLPSFTSSSVRLFQLSTSPQLKRINLLRLNRECDGIFQPGVSSHGERNPSTFAPIDPEL